MKPIYVFLATAGITTAFLVLRRSTGKPESSDDDVNAIARMLIAETRLRASEAELAAIASIALNRARKWGASITDVVSGPKVGATKYGWNGGALYISMFDRADEKPEWEASRAFARRVLSGEFDSVVARGFTGFVHPGAQSFVSPCNQSIPAVADGRWSPSYVPGFGNRCIPKWVHGGTVVGKALFS